MTEFNPYSAPKSEVGNLNGHNIWHDKEILVMKHDAVLSDRCFKCGAPASNHLEHNLYDNSPSVLSYFFLLFLAVFVPPFLTVFIIGYMITGWILRKSAMVEIGLCQKHWIMRTILRPVDLGISILMIFVFLLAVFGGGNPIPLIGVLIGLVLTAIIIKNIVNIPLIVDKIDDEFIWIKGFKPDFLKDYPDFHG